MPGVSHALLTHKSLKLCLFLFSPYYPILVITTGLFSNVRFFLFHLKSGIFPLLWFGHEGSPTTIRRHAHRGLDFPAGRATKRFVDWEVLKPSMG